MTNTFDPMTATVAEVLDWLAERDGWKRVVPGHPDYTITLSAAELWKQTSGGFVYGHHPITLDRLASMLPKGWKWDMVFQHDEGWHVETMGNKQTFTGNGFTEHEARARVVAAVLMRAKP